MLPGVRGWRQVVTLVALAAGVTLLVWQVCAQGASEILREGESGFVRDALDVAGIAAALDRLDPAAARRMGEHEERVAHRR